MEEARTEIYPPRVGMYRTGVFLDLGFEVDHAVKLANSRVDLHTIRRAVREQGCTTAVAWQIWGTE